MQRREAAVTLQRWERGRQQRLRYVRVLRAWNRRAALTEASGSSPRDLREVIPVPSPWELWLVAPKLAPVAARTSAHETPLQETQPGSGGSGATLLPGALRRREGADTLTREDCSMTYDVAMAEELSTLTTPRDLQASVISEPWDPQELAAKACVGRLLACLMRLRPPGLPRPHAAVMRLVSRKRWSSPWVKYRDLVGEAECACLAGSTKRLRADVAWALRAAPAPRDGWSLGPDQQGSLLRILRAYKRRAGQRASGEGGLGFGYVKGLSALAMMCLGFARGREEGGFWLLAYLVEDVLGLEYFSSSPALLGYHGDRAAALALVARECPGLASALGAQGLAQFLTLLTWSSPHQKPAGTQ